MSLILFGVKYKWFKQKKRRFTTRLANCQQTLNNTEQNDISINTKVNPLNNINITTKNGSRDGLNNPEQAYISDYNNIIEGGKAYKELSKPHNKPKLSTKNVSKFLSYIYLMNKIKQASIFNANGT